MRNWKKIVGISGAIAALSLGISAAVWSSVPDPMPIHWDASGHPDGFASRTFGLLFSPLLGVALASLLGFVLGRDAKTRPVAGYYTIGSTVFALGLHLLIVQAALRPDAALSMAGLSVLLGGVFVGMGVLLPRVPPNRWAGIRLPWTMKDELVWDLTHRFAAWCFVIAGVVTAVAGILAPAPWSFVVMLSSILLATIVPCVYSYVIARARRARR